MAADAAIERRHEDPFTTNTLSVARLPHEVVQPGGLVQRHSAALWREPSANPHLYNSATCDFEFYDDKKNQTH